MQYWHRWTSSAWISIGTKATARSARSTAFRCTLSRSLFERPIGVFPDPKHSADEERFIGIGKTDDGRSVFIAFTLRTGERGTLLRPISARYMHKKEVDYYEKEVDYYEKETAKARE